MSIPPCLIAPAAAAVGELLAETTQCGLAWCSKGAQLRPQWPRGSLDPWEPRKRDIKPKEIKYPPKASSCVALEGFPGRKWANGKNQKNEKADGFAYVLGLLFAGAVRWTIFAEHWAVKPSDLNTKFKLQPRIELGTFSLQD